MFLPAIFIAQPWLALVPALSFFALYKSSKPRYALIAATAWLLYTPYEFAMHERWLCSGECNIRVDLLLLYPPLIAVSAAAIVAAIRAKRH
jgi:hypothetical protein